MNCVIKPNSVCPLNLPYCPIVAPGIRYCSHSGYYLEDDDGEKE